MALSGGPVHRSYSSESCERGSVVPNILCARIDNRALLITVFIRLSTYLSELTECGYC